MLSNKFLSFTLLLPFITCESIFCPDSSLILPCTCLNNSIYCIGDEHVSIDLPSIFEKMDAKLQTDEKHFEGFYLSNTAITELPDNTFKDITFDMITINSAVNLSRIHERAFSANLLVTKHIEFVANPKLDESLFKIASRFVNVDYIDLSDNNITRIPDDAFAPIDGSLKNVTKVSLYGRAIESLGNNAFQRLENIRDIYIHNTNISHIPVKAFFIDGQSSDALLNIYLWNNPYITSASFEANTLLVIGRPIKLHFDHMSYLDENIFLPFLKANPKNHIDLGTGNDDFDCQDCRNYWLVKHNDMLDRLVPHCSNRKAFSDETNFAKCK